MILNGKTNITHLPDEMLWLIYSQLDIVSQLNLSSVSKQFRRSYITFHKKYSCVTFRGSQAQWFMIEIETGHDKWRREFYSNYQNITEIRSIRSNGRDNTKIEESRRMRGIRPDKLAKLHFKLFLHNSRVDSLLVGMTLIFDCLIDNNIRTDLLIIPYMKQTEVIIDHLRPSKLFISHIENNLYPINRKIIKNQLSRLQIQYAGPMKDINVNDFITSNIRSLIITSDIDYFTVEELVTILRAWRNQETKLEEITASVTFNEDLRNYDGFETSELFNSMCDEVAKFEVSLEEWFWRIHQLHTSRKAHLICSYKNVKFCEIH
ncbi:unnamed protein product [Auanema sp. JU1783]|nr:unnamed protein product [Auanema sp. JU1783]